MLRSFQSRMANPYLTSPDIPTKNPKHESSRFQGLICTRGTLADVSVNAPTQAVDFCFAVPELTGSAGIQLNERVSFATSYRCVMSAAPDQFRRSGQNRPGARVKP